MPGWPALRLWLEGRATMTEITTTLSIDDVDLAGRALDEWRAAEVRAEKRAQAQAGRR